jgi:hypothetical protein
LIRRPTYALSLKQPWAALLLGGLKTIEVRKWGTGVRGKVFIHAAQIPDKRPEGWTRLPEELRPLAEISGGVIGCAELTGCVSYRTPAGFLADATKHLNEPDWFVAPRMYGFCFRSPVVVPFVPYKGNVRFFTFKMPETS